MVGWLLLTGWLVFFWLGLGLTIGLAGVSTADEHPTEDKAQAS